MGMQFESTAKSTKPLPPTDPRARAVPDTVHFCLVDLRERLLGEASMAREDCLGAERRLKKAREKEQEVAERLVEFDAFIATFGITSVSPATVQGSGDHGG